MNHLQNISLFGYVKIAIKGHEPEIFFQKCIEAGMVVWDIRKISDNECHGYIKLKEIDTIKKIRRKTAYKISFLERKGLPFILKRFAKKRASILALCLSMIFILILSNLIWNVSIKGVSMETEAKIVERLNEYGVRQGNWIFNVGKPGDIQQQLMHDLPELLWVGVKKKGTTFELEGVEKTLVEEKEIHGPRHLVAAKRGMIEKMFVSKGRPLVAVNQFVNPGDILVSGMLNDPVEENNDKEGEQATLISAEGDIYARTWYESFVTVPLSINEERLTGNQTSKRYIKIGPWSIPIWGFGRPDYEDQYIESIETPIYFFKWELPIKFKEQMIHEKYYETNERSEEEAIEVGIKQAREELLLSLKHGSEIISEKVLHQTIENGKVNLNLYFTVLEEISQPQSITQGD